MQEQRPFLVVIAGPNGSGKTSLTNYLLSKGFDFGLYINPDDIAAELEGPYDHRVQEAQRRADERRAEAIARRQSFSFETVFSHPSKLDVLDQARRAGFEITLFFIAVENPNINVERVLTRVRTGGHDVPADRIVARYARTMALLSKALERVDRAFLFDNSATFLGPPVFRGRLVATMESRDREALKIRGNRLVPGWVKKYVVGPALRRSLIATERLKLRVLLSEDAEIVAALANDRRIAENVERVPHPYRLSDAENLIVNARLNEKEATLLITLEDETAIGVCRILEDVHASEIGCWLGVSYWGRGYATEATRALIDYAFAHMPAFTLSASVRVTNSAGRRVLEKCAFQWTGVGLVRIRALGNSVPVDRFVLQRSIWESLKSWI